MSYRGESPCPYCGDSAFLHIQTKIDREKGKIGESILPCCCTNSILINKKFPTLLTVADPPANEFISIAKKYTVIKNNKRVIKNCVFYGSEKQFFYLFKSMMLFYWNTLTTFELLNGLSLVHNYYVGKDEKTLGDLQKYKLLGISFISVAKNEAMSATILEVVQNRIRLEEATWIYALTPESLVDSKEYSTELGDFLKDFETCDLSRSFSYPGFGNTEQSASRQRRAAQINAANV